jgi:hypothetical protein
MKRFAIALTALTIASVAVAPTTYAAVNFDQLRQENLDKDGDMTVSGIFVPWTQSPSDCWEVSTYRSDRI